MENELSREQIEEWRVFLRKLLDERATPSGGGALCRMALSYLDAKADAQRYRAKRNIDHQRLKTTVAYELASDDERALMVSVWFKAYDAAIDQAMHKEHKEKGGGDE